MSGWVGNTVESWDPGSDSSWQLSTRAPRWASGRLGDPAALPALLQRLGEVSSLCYGAHFLQSWHLAAHRSAVAVHRATCFGASRAGPVLPLTNGFFRALIWLLMAPSAGWVIGTTSSPRFRSAGELLLLHKMRRPWGQAVSHSFLCP